MYRETLGTFSCSLIIRQVAQRADPFVILLQIDELIGELFQVSLMKGFSDLEMAVENNSVIGIIDSVAIGDRRLSI